MSAEIVPQPRASILPPESEEESVGAEYLTFRVADELMALPLSSIREILKVPVITRVPRTRPSILGVVSVRGRITTVVDLALRLGLRDERWSPERGARVLLAQVDSDSETIGLLVDSVEVVRRLDEGEVETEAELASGFSEHVYGLGRPTQSGVPDDEVEVIVLLDPAALLEVSA